jgi:mono/diheme cytochrome c family protein
MNARRLFSIIVLAGAALCPAASLAQDFGEPLQGATFAKAACSECHAVDGDQRSSPNRYAPSFRSVAQTPGMTATALHVWFETPHPSMPHLILRDSDKENVFSYILSLKHSK